MNKIFILLLLAFGLQSFTSPKSDLKARVEALIELSVSVSDESEKEIKRIQSFLEPSDNQATASIQLYQIWSRELKTFGKQAKRIQKITFLKKKEMAFVDIAIVRTVKKKNAKGKEVDVKENFTMKTTWLLIDGEWVQRTKRFAGE